MLRPAFVYQVPVWTLCVEKTIQLSMTRLAWKVQVTLAREAGRLLHEFREVIWLRVGGE